MTDAELVRQALAGSRGAYGQLARRWAPRVLAVCHARAGRAAAEDLAQEALLRGLRGLSTLADPEKFGQWITGIAVRACLDWRKSPQRREVPLDAALASGATLTSIPASLNCDSATRRERAAALAAEVEQLPPAYREVLTLYYSSDCTYAELAETLGVSSATVNARLTKARAMLRSRLPADAE